MVKKDILYLLMFYILRNVGKFQKTDSFDLYEHVLNCYDLSYSYSNCMDLIVSHGLPMRCYKLISSFVKFVRKFEKIVN